MTLYLSVFARMHTNDVYKDQKRHKIDTKDSKSHDESSKEIKSILGPKTTKISTKMHRYPTTVIAYYIVLIIEYMSHSNEPRKHEKQ